MGPRQLFSIWIWLAMWLARLTRRTLRSVIRNTPELRGQRVSGPNPAHSRTTSALVVVVVGALLGTLSCASWRGARLYQRGTQALEQGEVELAVGDLEEAARLVPDASEVHNHLGLAQLAAGRDDLALGSFERAAELDCDNLAARDNLEVLQVRLLQEAAIASVSEAARAGPNAGSNGTAGAKGTAGANGEAP